MTVPATAPANIKSLAAILAATAAWSAVASAADIYWPTETGAPAGTYAVLVEGSEEHQVIIMTTTLTEGALVEVAEALRYSLSTHDRLNGTGLYIGREITYEQFGVSSDAQSAGDGTGRPGIILTLPTGIQRS